MLTLDVGAGPENLIGSISPIRQISHVYAKQFTASTGGSSGTGSPFEPQIVISPWGIPQLQHAALGALSGSVGTGSGTGDAEPMLALAPWGLSPLMHVKTGETVAAPTDIGASSGFGDPREPMLALGPWGITPLSHTFATGNTANRPPVWTIALSEIVFDTGVARTIDLVAEGYLVDPDGDTMTIGIYPTPPAGFSVLQSPPRLVFDGTTAEGDYDGYLLWADDGHGLGTIMDAAFSLQGSLTTATFLQAVMSAQFTLQGTLVSPVFLASTMSASFDLSGTLSDGRRTDVDTHDGGGFVSDADVRRYRKKMRSLDAARANRWDEERAELEVLAATLKRLAVPESDVFHGDGALSTPAGETLVQEAQTLLAAPLPDGDGKTYATKIDALSAQLRERIAAIEEEEDILLTLA